MSPWKNKSLSKREFLKILPLSLGSIFFSGCLHRGDPGAVLRIEDITRSRSTEGNPKVRVEVSNIGIGIGRAVLWAQVSFGVEPVLSQSREVSVRRGQREVYNFEFEAPEEHREDRFQTKVWIASPS